MIKFKNEQMFDKFIDKIVDLSSITYEDIINFASENNLQYGIAALDEDNDTLYICTNENECFLQSNGEISKCRGKYVTFLKDEDYSAMNLEMNNDLEDILSYKRDIICINTPFFEEG